MSVISAATVRPLRGVGGFFALTLDTAVAIVTPPFAWRELIEQVSFLARVRRRWLDGPGARKRLVGAGISRRSRMHVDTLR